MIADAVHASVVPDLLPPQLERYSPDPQGYTMACNWIQAWDPRRPIDAGLIGVPFTRGSANWTGTHEAADAIRDGLSEYATRSFDFDLDIRDLRVSDIGDVRLHMTDAQRCHRTIESTLVQLYRTNPDFIPIVIGGDHSIAAPSVRAYSIAHEARLGLIDFDAHNDLRDPALDGPASGTPFRQLIDGGFVRGRNATQVGLHGFLSSPDLKEYADLKGLKMVSARKIRNVGIQTVLDDALERATSGTDGIYVSLDIDVMDPAFAPGTASPCSGGLVPGDIFEAVYHLGSCPQVRALDLVEVDPLKDVKGMTSRLAAIIILSFLAGVQGRKSGSTAAERRLGSARA